MDKSLIRTTDLGNDWFASQWADGSMTLINHARDQFIDLPRSSVETLREIFAAADLAPAA